MAHAADAGPCVIPRCNNNNCVRWPCFSLHHERPAAASGIALLYAVQASPRPALMTETAPTAPPQLLTGVHALPPRPHAPPTTPPALLQSAAEPVLDTAAFAEGKVRQADTRPVLLVLVGLPGSGKTTFGNALVEQLDGWARFSQDESASGRRQEVEAAVSAALARGENVIVDRVNFDPT